jgi:acyl carrier protein
MTTKKLAASCALSCLIGLPLQASAITIDPTLTTLVADQMGVDSGEVTATARINDDLGADSLDVVELMLAVEEEYSVSIPEETCQNIQTVADLQTVINGGLSSSAYCPHA